MRIHLNTGKTPICYFLSSFLGCFIFIVSSFGVLGAHRENLCYLRTYKYFLIVILVFELCTGIFGFAFWPEMKKMADYKISQAIKKYTDDSQLRDMVDYVQRHFACCGSLTVDDWDSNPYYNCGKGGSYRSCGVPWSCCLDMYDKNLQCGLKVRKKRSKKKMSKSIHIVGCLDKLFEFIRVNMVLLGGLAIGCNIPLLLGIFLSHRLTKQIKKLVSKYYEANDTFHWTENKMNSQNRLILTTSEDK